MSQYWNPLVRDLEPYVPGEQPKDQRYIKLNTNENPYPPSSAVVEAMQDELMKLRLYPDPEGTALKQAIADYYGITPPQVFVGNGSDEVLAHIFHALFQPDTPILYPDISYSFYPVYSKFYQLQAEVIPLRNDFSLDLTAYNKPNGGIIFANPNAPTGIAVSRSRIESLLESNTNSVVVVDEAYVDFGAETALPLIERYPNIIIVQTLSKSRSLAGLRVGFAVGAPELIEGLERAKNSFNSYPLGRLELAAATAAVADASHLHEVCQKIIATREWTTTELIELGFSVLPSAANFILTSPPKAYKAEVLYHTLKARGILVRFFKKPRLENYLRITIGTDEQMQQLMTVLGELMAGSN